MSQEAPPVRKNARGSITYPAGVLLTARVLGDESIKEQALKEAIPEILRFNIVESDIRNVI